MNINQTIIISDLDGTLLSYSGEINARNIDAVKRFEKAGGIFTLATGRTPLSAKKYIDELEIKSPIIATNGGSIYDYTTNTVIWSKNLPLDYKLFLKSIYNKFNDIGIVVITDNTSYVVIRNNGYIDAMRKFQTHIFSEGNIEELSDNAQKMLLFGNDNKLIDVQRYLMSQNSCDFTFVRSSSSILEVLPINISKAYPLKRFVELFSLGIENVVAIGDYYNDVEMIKLAGLGVAVSGAVDELKENAQLIVGSCEDGGVADLIEYLMDG